MKQGTRPFLGSIALLLSLCFGVASVCALSGRSEAVRLISVPIPITNAYVTANDASTMGRFNHDGRVLVFTSWASDLVTNRIAGPHLNVYARDVATGKTLLVSSSMSGESGNGESYAPDISANGRWVAFVSRASNLVANDTNGFADVFLRDLIDGTTHCISVTTEGVSANGDSFAPQLSATGKQVCFGSYATNLDAARRDLDRRIDVFVRDLDMGQTSLVSGEFRPGREVDVMDYSISGDGRWVAFLATPSFVIESSTSGRGMMAYLHDRQVGVTRRLETADATWFGSKGWEARTIVFAADTPRLAVSAWSTTGAGLTVSNVVLVLDPDEHGDRIKAEIVGASGVRADDPPQLAFSANGQTLAFLQALEPSQPAVLRIWQEGSGVTTATNRTTEKPIPARKIALSPDGGSVALITADSEVLAGPHTLSLLDWKSGLLVPIRGSGPNLSLSGNHLVAPCFSGDGEWLSFQDTSGKWLGDYLNHASDIFIYELRTLQLGVASRPLDQLSQVRRNSTSLLAAGISADGRHVLMTVRSRDGFGDGGAGGGVLALSVRDIATGRTTGVPWGVAANEATLPDFESAALSANGRHVAFSVGIRFQGTNGETVVTRQVFVRDLALQTTHGAALQLGRDGKPLVRTLVTNLQISADGRYVAYFADGTLESSTATRAGHVVMYDLMTGLRRGIANTDTLNPLRNGLSLAGFGGKLVALVQRSRETQVLLYDAAKDVTEVLARGNIGASALSYDGRRVILVVPGAVETAPPTLHWRDEGGSTWQSVIPKTDARLTSTHVVLSRDSRWVFLRGQSASSWDTQFPTYRVELATGATSLLEMRSDGSVPHRPRSRFVTVSGDGRYAAFQSQLDDLAVGDLNAVDDVFYRDFRTGRTEMVKRLDAPAWGSDRAIRPLLSADGRRLVFSSWSSGFVENDLNSASDVFSVDLPSAEYLDDDGDAIDDGWEIAWFGNTLGGPSRDSDGDGMDDGKEYTAGSCPIDPESLFTISAKPVGIGQIVLEWVTAPGILYQLQSSEAGSDGWTTPFEPVVGNGGLAAIVVPVESMRSRFFRIQLEKIPAR